MSDPRSYMTDEQRREQDDIEAAFREVIKTASGKRVVFWMLEQCAIYRDAFAGENSAATNYALGEQNSGRKLLAMLDMIDPRFYPQLLLDIAEMKAMQRAATDAAQQENDDDEDA